VERKAKERVAERKAAAAAVSNPEGDGGMESLTVDVRNDTRQGKGIGLEINSMNTIVGVIKGSLAHKDGKLKIGDIITAVDGIPVKGKKLISAMDEKATVYKFTISRVKEVAAQDQAPTDALVDMEGWLFHVTARDGRALKLPKKRWVVLQGTTISWYDEIKAAEVNSQSLEGAVCTLPLRSTNYAMTPAMKAFAEMRQFPFMLSWPNGAVKEEIVFAASTSSDRAAWANVIKESIGRAKTGAPTKGWLWKEGGRRSGVSFAGWKRRWFVLPQPGATGEQSICYFDTPTSSASKGEIMLRGSDVFVPKEVRGIKKGYENNFCLASEATEKGKPVTLCTLLAASNAEERDMWVKSIAEVIKSIDTVVAPAKPVASSDSKPRPGKAGADAGASGVQSGNTVNLEQMKMLDVDELLTLRPKQLKNVLEYMGHTHGECIEKRDLVAKIVNLRGKKA
jgi:hypothetical protein